jgi:TonB-linked SusC/RagA family outer membrane protein
MKKLLLTVALLLPVILLCAQRTISGKVTDENRNPVVGANVSVKETNVGTTSDANGNYSLTIDSRAKTLVVTFVGMLAEEIVIGNRSSINASLRTEESAMKEVVVIGYGTQKKKSVTAAISKVDVNSINNLAGASFDKQLAGRAPGVQVTTPSGLTNQEPRIRIRGVNSINTNRDPLIVIDGVPFQTGSVLQNINSSVAVANGTSTTPVSGVSNNSGLSSVSNTNALSSIDPNDIESIEVLKDGSATAIYGSRAANGVILITTKKGKQGKLNVNYNMYIGTFSPQKTYSLLNAQDFVTTANEKYTNAGQPAQAFMSAENTNTDWQDAVIKKNPFVQSHSLSFDGGSANTSYYASLSYMAQDGMIKTNNTKRYSVRMNITQKVNKWFRVGNNLFISRVDDNDQNNGGNSLGGAIAAATRALPNVRIYNPDHPTGYNITPDGAALGQDANLRPIDNNYQNIIFGLDKNKYNSIKYFITNNAFIELTPIKGLTIRSQGSVDYQSSKDFRSWDPRHGDGKGPNGLVENTNISRNRYVWQNYFNYNKSFALHNFLLTGGMEIQRDQSDYSSALGTNVSDIFFITNNVINNSVATQSINGGYAKAGFTSVFGRLNYDFNNKYFAQVSFRRDGQSSLSEDNRYGNFPGVSVGWRMSEEKFWDNSGLSKTINEFKIRASYAVVGNTLNGFPYLSTYGLSPYASINGIAIARVGNDALQWETNEKIDIGFDMSLLGNRFNVSFDYFKNKNDNLVLAAPLPSSLGIPNNSIFRNIGSMENKGFEVSVGGLLMNKGAFTWNFNANFTSTKNKVLELYEGQDIILPGPNSSTLNILRVGQPINALYGYVFAGVNSGNGNPMYYKADGTLIQGNIANTTYYTVIKADDPALGTQTTLATGDRQVMGNILPTWFGGLTNTFTYKNFSLDIFFRYSGGNKIFNITRQQALLSQAFVNNGTEILTRWTTPGQITTVPKLWIGRDNFSNLQNDGLTRFVEDGDYLRLQNVGLSYTFNSKKMEASTNGVIKSLKIFANGQNLAVWTKYSGIDPDAYSELGIDNASVPLPRSYSIGLNMGF